MLPKKKFNLHMCFLNLHPVVQRIFGQVWKLLLNPGVVLNANQYSS